MKRFAITTLLLPVVLLAVFIGSRILGGARDSWANAQKEARRRTCVRYQIGDGVRQDSTQALKCFLAVAESGDAVAYTDLGVLYLNGIGTESDKTEAMKWFLLAADHGDPYAAQMVERLSLELHHRDLVEANSRAAKWRVSHPTASQ